MPLSYLTSTLSEDEYLDQRFKQDRGTGRMTRSAINNAKMFCTDAFNRELIIVMRDIREEVLKNQNLDTALIFLQKLVHWSNEDHPNVFMPKGIRPTPISYYAKDIPTIRGYIGQIRLYMKKVVGIPISSEDVKDYKLSYPPEKDKEEAEPLLPEEFRLICDNQRSFKRQMLYRIMKDCEARIGAMVQLRKKHFNTEVRPIQVTFPKSIMKKKNGIAYTNVKFVAGEDEEGILKLLSMIDDEDLVFGTGGERELAVNNEETAWKRLVTRLGFIDRYSHNNRLKKNIHSIKSMTFTAAEEAVNETYAHAYGDHALYTKTYLRWSLEKKIKKFRLLEPHISIYTTIKRTPEDEKLSIENTELRKTVASHEEILSTLSEDKKLETRSLPDDKLKEIMTQILKENNII